MESRSELRDEFGCASFTLSGPLQDFWPAANEAAWLTVSGPQNLKREALGRLEVIADTYLSVNGAVQLGDARVLRATSQFQEQLCRASERISKDSTGYCRAGHVAAVLAVEGGWYAVLHFLRYNPTKISPFELLTCRMSGFTPVTSMTFGPMDSGGIA